MKKAAFRSMNVGRCSLRDEAARREIAGMERSRVNKRLKKGTQAMARIGGLSCRSDSTGFPAGGGSIAVLFGEQSLRLPPGKSRRRSPEKVVGAVKTVQLFPDLLRRQ